MASRALQDAKQAWAGTYAGLGDAEVDQRVSGLVALVRGIAEHGAVSPESFAAELGIESSRATGLFSDLVAAGFQVDARGHVVGAALTTRQSPHQIRLGGQKLYAWCALDALFIPGLLDQVGEVESSCPVSGETVRLTVTPEGVQRVDPPHAVLSIVLPGVAVPSAQAGPASPT